MADLYCDGGLIGCNPSPHGGTWAWCQVENGLRVRSDSGFVIPMEMGFLAITNNLTELLAAIEGLDSMPDGWCGCVYTDSLVTLRRISLTRKQAKLNGIPPYLASRLAACKTRLGQYSVRLLGGHPTRRELVNGFKKSGLPVSIHNVWCDKACREAASKRKANV